MYFDAHLIASAPIFTEPSPLSGAIFFGPHAVAAAQHHSGHHPQGTWLCAHPLEHLIGTSDTRFPIEADIIDLVFEPGGLLRRLKQPEHEWFPLFEASRAQRRLYRFTPSANAAECAGIRKLARLFPHARMIIDPFQHGPASAWQALVRLAEMDNIWITSLGLMPGEACVWPSPSDLAEAMHFTIGEVGAGKLLLASGGKSVRTADEVSTWLAAIPTLNDAERALIESESAREIFSR
jgi:hypothetical protein